MTNRTPELTTDITTRLTSTDQSGLDAGLLVPLLRLLATGEPVTLDQLAAASGRGVADVRGSLDAVPDTEYDDQGRIIGQGLTLRPTPHRFTVAGQELYTWCALDTLIFPRLLDRPAHVESTSPTSGKTVRVSIDPSAGVTSVEPPTAVVSLVVPAADCSIRPGFCNQVHYFTSPEEAAPWAADIPEAQLLPVAEAHQLALTLAAQFLDQAQTTADESAEASHCCG
ncbi:organomercurial lyase MerB [Nocardioides sp. NPDC051685]|uniref:organomercurial lyase MerB n=1 Tax=Nocardioides sp. NPDC051685 TaxID=3364334 RepID=UPI0037938EFC